MAAQALGTPGHLDRGERVADDVLFDRRPEESLHGGDGTRGIVSLVRTMKRYVHFGESPERRPKVDQAPPDREPIRAATESGVPSPDRPRPYQFGLVLEDRGHGRHLVAQHKEGTALYDPGLLGRDRLSRRSEDLRVIELDVGQYRDVRVADVRDRLSRRSEDLRVIELDVGQYRYVRVADVRRVKAAPEADLHHNDLRGHVGEPGVGGRRHELEPGRPDAQEALDLRHRPENTHEGLVSDLGAVELEPLVDPLQVWAQVRAD